MQDVREYRRLSKDRHGTSTSIARQAHKNQQAQRERDWSAGQPYVDDDRSASPYRRKGREDFERLCCDLEAGTFGAKVLQAYETSRLTRETEEVIRLLKLCRASGTLIYITQHDRIYNPANARDRKDLKDSATDDEYSSDQTSLRVGDTAAFEAERGRPHGQAPFGYKAVYDERTGELVNWVPDDIQAPVVKELFERLEKGHSLKRLSREFGEAGYVNKSGKPFSSQHLRNMAMRPVYAGIRSYKGREYKGVWKALVPEERFRVVLRLLSDPARVTTRSGRAVHEFTGVLVCERCCGFTRVKKIHGSGTLTYQCRNSHVSMLKEDADEILTGKLIEYLSREDVYNALTAHSGDDDEVSRVRTELATLRGEKQLMDAETPKTLAEVRVLARATDALEVDIATLEEKERQLTLPPALAAILGARDNIAEAWFKAPIEACREIVRHVMVPQYLGQPVITCVPVGQWHTPASERLQWNID